MAKMTELEARTAGNTRVYCSACGVILGRPEPGRYAQNESGYLCSHCSARTTPRTRVVKYLGEARCDICDRTLDREGDTMYDAAMRVGTWAKMCSACYRVHGAGALGVGHGQRYVRTNGEMVKVEG